MISSGRLFHILRPVVANDHSPTETRHAGRTSCRLELDDWRQLVDSVAVPGHSVTDIFIYLFIISSYTWYTHGNEIIFF